MVGGAGLERQAARNDERTVRCHYLFVIEWLGEQDTKTGQILAERVESNDGVRVRFASCMRAADVLAQIAWAAEHVSEHGVPIIHIEAHGIDPTEPDRVSPGLQGPDGAGDVENLLWDELAVPLRNLNLAAEFRLMVVGAACYSMSTLVTVETRNTAPFAMLIGFHGRVHPTRLLACCRELYRGLFSPNQSLAGAFIAARNELNEASEGELLHATSVYDLAQDVVRRLIFDELEPVHRSGKNAYLSEAILAARGEVITPDEVGMQFPDYMRNVVLRFVALWFAYDALPVNRTRFAIDVDEIIREAQEHYSHAR